MNKASLWLNKDGMSVGFGIRGKEVNSSSVIVAGDGQTRTAILKIDATQLKATPDGKELANAVVIPVGANIKDVRVLVHTAFAGGTSVSIAGYTTAKPNAVDSATGFLNAVLTATLVAGYDNTYTAPGAGAGGGYIATLLATAVKVVSTAAGTYTAGVATVEIDYETPAN
jgi:hypothetical protein